EVDTVSPGWVQSQLDYLSNYVDTRLRKRYVVPFVAPIPPVIEGWITRLLTLRVLLRRGIDPTDAQFAQLLKDHDAADSELKEAADATNGLFDLPLRADNTSSAISQGGVLAYSEQSPYVGYDIQRDVGRQQDDSRRGN